MNDEFEIFQSPENFTSQYRGRDEVILHYPSQTIPYPAVSENIEAIAMEPIRYNNIHLRRFRASMHISEEMLENMGLRLTETIMQDSRVLREQQSALLAKIYQTCKILYEYLIADSVVPEHITILDRVRVVYQRDVYTRSYIMLIDMTLYSTQHRDVEYARGLFQDILLTVITTGTHPFEAPTALEERRIARQERGAQTFRDIIPYRGNSPAPNAGDLAESFRRLADSGLSANDLANSFGQSLQFNGLGIHFKKYDDKAEERATKFLKSILKEKCCKSIMHMTDWNRFEKRGEVIIKKAYKDGLRTYIIQKSSMINVLETDAKKKTTQKYRLCIEPKKQGTICPTDEVIAKIKLIQSDEKKLHKIANKFKDKQYGNIEYDEGRYSNGVFASPQNNIGRLDGNR